MKRKLTEVVDDITSRYEAASEQYSVKQIEEETLLAYEAGRIIDDPVRARIHQVVGRRDKASRSEPDDELQFAEFAYPRSLVIGDTERQPSRTAILRHVLADQAMKEDSNIRSNEAMQRVRRRNLALLPYLERGLTVIDAVSAYSRDHEDPKGEGGEDG